MSIYLSFFLKASIYLTWAIPTNSTHNFILRETILQSIPASNNLQTAPASSNLQTAPATSNLKFLKLLFGGCQLQFQPDLLYLEVTSLGGATNRTTVRCWLWWC